MKTAEMLEELDRAAMEAFRRALVASTDPFLGTRTARPIFEGPQWSEFLTEMARLEEIMRVRHAMKHAAAIEAARSCLPFDFSVYRETVSPAEGCSCAIPRPASGRCLSCYRRTRTRDQG
jgi:hypothetical protein